MPNSKNNFQFSCLFKLLMLLIFMQPDYLQASEPVGLKMLDSLVKIHSSNPNEALKLGFKILELPNNELPDSIKAFTKVEIGYILNKQGFYSQALGFYLDAANLLTQIGLKFKSGYLFVDIGNLYFKQKQYNLAKEKYSVAKELFESSNDFGGIYTCTNNFGLIDKELGNYNAAKKYFKEALQIAESKLDIPFLQAHSYAYLGDLDNVSGNKDSAIANYDRALQYKVKLNTDNIIGLNHKKAAQIYLARGDTSSAITRYKLAEANFLNQLNVFYLIEIHLELSALFKKLGETSSAIGYLQSAADLAQKEIMIEKLIDIQKRFIDFYSELKDQEKLIYHQSQLSKMLEELYNEDIIVQLSKLDIQQQIEIYQQKLRIAELELNRNRFFKYSSIAIIIFLLVLLWLLSARYRYKKKYDEELLLRTEEKYRYELEVERIKKEQLTRELVIKATHIQKQNDFLLRLKRDLQNNSEKYTQKGFSSGIRKAVNTISGEMRNDFAWEQFSEQFVKIYPGFLDKITHLFPDLTSKDLKICAYHRMNLDTKEIAALASLSVRAIQTSRYRLRQKMKIPKETSFQEFINTL